MISGFWIVVICSKIIITINTTPILKRETVNGIKPRIWNGDDASEGEFPFISAVFVNTDYKNNQPNNQNICGGSILSSNVILTAAHCVVRETHTHDEIHHPRDINVYVGVANFSTTETGEQQAKVKGIVVHKDYSSNTVQNDIALLILKDDLTLSGSVSTISLPENYQNYAAGTTVTVIGWGTTETGSTSDNLQKLTYQVTPLSDCKKAYENAILAGMMCSGKSPDILTKHSGRGDSGGPMFKRLQDNKFIQLGIVSWGPEEQTENTFDVNTDVYYFKSWINTNINSLGEYNQEFTSTDSPQIISFSNLRNFLYKIILIKPSSDRYVKLTVKSGTLHYKDYLAVYDGDDILNDKMLARLSIDLPFTTFTATSTRGLTMVIVTSTSAESDSFTVEHQQVSDAGTKFTLACGVGYYACKDRYSCVTSSEVCNHVNNCVDSSDENVKVCNDEGMDLIDNSTSGEKGTDETIYDESNNTLQSLVHNIKLTLFCFFMIILIT